MAVFLLLGFVFVLVFLLSTGFSYWMVGGVSERRRIMTRLSALQEATVRHDPEAVRVLKTDFRSEIPFTQRVMGQLPGIPELRLFLEQAAIEMEVEVFLVITVGIFTLVTLFFLTFGAPLLTAAIAGIVLATIPSCVVWVKRQRRFLKFEEQFPDAIDQLARAVRAGHAFTTGFDLIGEELPDPVGKEFRITYTQQNLGVPLSTALDNFAARMPLPDVRFFVAAVQIQRESGGNLGEVLDSLSYVVRERFKLLRQVRVYTAEGRLSMYILSAIPIVGGIATFLMNPDYMTPLFTDPQGQTWLIVAAAMQVIGYVVIRRMINIKV